MTRTIDVNISEHISYVWRIHAGEGASRAHTHRGVVLQGLKECAPSALVIITKCSSVWFYQSALLPPVSVSSLSFISCWQLLPVWWAGNGISLLIYIAFILALRSGHLLTAHSASYSGNCIDIKVMNFPWCLSWLSQDAWLLMGWNCLARIATPDPVGSSCLGTRDDHFKEHPSNALSPRRLCWLFWALMVLRRGALKEVAIIFIISTIVWPQVNNRANHSISW